MAAVALPPIAAFVYWAGVLAIAGATGKHPVWTVEPRNLPEALALRDAGAVVRLVEDGANPNEAAEVRGRIIQREHEILTPIEAAAASRQRELVQLLLDLGAVPDAVVWQRAWCISDAPGVRELLQAHRPPGAPEDCADP
jgi:hypothetical protein